MFEIEVKETNNVELYLSTSEEHARIGTTLRDFTFTFTHDEWMVFSKVVAALTDEMNPEKESEIEKKMEPVHAILQPSEPEMWPQVKGRADEILDALMMFGPLTYNELAKKMDVTYQRVVRLVSQMVRDGIKLNREGRPRKVSLG